MKMESLQMSRLEGYSSMSIEEREFPKENKKPGMKITPWDLKSIFITGVGGKASRHSGLVNALKDKLQTLVGTSSGYIESLHPKIKKQVETLQKMQAEELLSKFLEEKAALEAKYQNMYEPLYSKCHDIVNG